MRGRAHATTALSLALACAPAADLSLPLIEGLAPQSVVLLDVSNDGDPTGATGLVVPLGEPALLTNTQYPVALGYRSTLGELSWRAGPLSHVPDGTSRLRRPDAIWRHGDEGWTDASAEPWPVLEALRFDWPEDRCGGRDTCFGDDGLCVPCHPEPPAPPEPPRPWPPLECREGMFVVSATVGDDVVTGCSARLSHCGPGERASLDGGCVILGGACAVDADGWASDAPAQARFVRAEPTSGGDGSRARPWSLDEALELAADGEPLWLSVGDHALQRARIDRRTALVGVCAKDTRVSARQLAVAAPIRLDGLSLRFESMNVTADVRVEGASLEGVIDAAGGTLVLIDARVHTSTLSAMGSTVTVQRSELVIDQLMVVDRGHVTLEGAKVDGHLLVHHGTSLNIRDSAFVHADFRSGSLDVLASSVRLDHVAFVNGSAGFVLWEGATGVGSGLYFEGQSYVGAGMFRSAVDFSISQALFRKTGAGLLAVDAAHVTIEDVAFVDIAREAISVYTFPGEDRPQLVARHVRVRGARDALRASSARVRLEHARLEDLRDHALAVLTSQDSLDTELDAFDIDVYGVQGGIAVDVRGNVNTKTKVVLERVALTELEGIGVLFGSGQLDATARDLSIRGISPHVFRPDETCAGVLSVSCGGTGIVIRAQELRAFELTLERFIVEDAAYAGLAIGRLVQPEVRWGLVRRSPIGLYTAPELEWRDVLRHVALDTPALIELTNAL